jgi:hypothetical protein
LIYETDLAGAWMFALDPGSIGIHQEWFTITLPDTIGLPGSIDEASKTPLTKGGTMAHLSRRHPYVGKAALPSCLVRLIGIWALDEAATIISAPEGLSLSS